MDLGNERLRRALATDGKFFDELTTPRTYCFLNDAFKDDSVQCGDWNQTGSLKEGNEVLPLFNVKVGDGWLHDKARSSEHNAIVVAGSELRRQLDRGDEDPQGVEDQLSVSVNHTQCLLLLPDLHRGKDRAVDVPKLYEVWQVSIGASALI